MKAGVRPGVTTTPFDMNSHFVWFLFRSNKKNAQHIDHFMDATQDHDIG